MRFFNDSGIIYQTVINSTRIVAHIPQEALTKAHTIPGDIMNWILLPSAENRMKLLIRGVHVSYDYADSAAYDSSMKEVA